MSEWELARVRDQVAQLPGSLRGPSAVDAGRGVAAEAVLQAPAAGDDYPSTQDVSSVSGRWIAFGSVQLVAAILAGASHFGARGGRLEPEIAANIAVIGTLVSVIFGVLALRLGASMPMVLRSARRTPIIIALVLLPIGFTLGLVRLLTGESYEDVEMIRAAVVQAVGFAALLVIIRLTPGAAELRARAGLSDAECAELRVRDPELAQRMKDAEIQALLALTALGQVDAQLAERESARIDERWGESGESSPST
ncbi:hypothetical protein OVN20_04395 [Microcella daejeonensis]|uniref:hypothetical protein n=1 Tax=Microcella daejeonensis TaxID=2994971 RepID=UPI00226DDA3A|nr:hypothetical protein [Microcella daejeonensis]WAB84812.1 hypothetical protein OVN20_04395 [Microcella daejeonensis]